MDFNYHFRMKLLEDIVIRAMDISVSATALVVLSPAYAGIAAAIYLTDGSPVIHKQRRYGRNGEIFSMFKFRSMKNGTPVVSSEYLNEIETTAPQTRIGRLLRQTYLDELPQFYNVLRGYMSLVGPRPILVSQDENDIYEEAY